MEIPLILVAAAYLLVLIGIVIVGSLNVYTALKFGMRSPVTTVMSIIFIFGTVVMVLATAVVVSGADWSSSLSVSVPDTNIQNFQP